MLQSRMQGTSDFFKIFILDAVSTEDSEDEDEGDEEDDNDEKSGDSNDDGEESNDSDDSDDDDDDDDGDDEESDSGDDYSTPSGPINLIMGGLPIKPHNRWQLWCGLDGQKVKFDKDQTKNSVINSEVFCLFCLFVCLFVFLFFPTEYQKLLYFHNLL